MCAFTVESTWNMVKRKMCVIDCFDEIFRNDLLVCSLMCLAAWLFEGSVYLAFYSVVVDLLSFQVTV